MSISKNQLKLITSLSQKKYRQQQQLFMAEGIKVVNEFLNSDFSLEHVFCTDDFETSISEKKITRVSEKDLKKISNLKSPNKVVALFKIPNRVPILDKGLLIALDSINDPGNLGTIIRLCDWFGVSTIVCSLNTVDCYNPKVIQSTMGSLARVSLHYTVLETYLETSQLPLFTADMGGENVYKKELPKEGVLILGNEANGISYHIKKLVKNSLSIPQFGKLKQTESLNVATATGILLSEFRRS